MLEVLIREAAARFGLGDKALPVMQMLLASMTSKDSGGLAGFLEQFKNAGLGPIVQSWLGGGPAARAIGNSQIEAVLGASDGLLPLITERLAAPRDNVTSALGYLLPAIVGKLTPGGSIAATLPAEVLELAVAGQALLSAPAPQDDAAGGGGGLLKWLPWIIVAIAALIGFSYFSKHNADSATPPAASAPASQPLPASAAAPAASAASPAN